MNAPNHPQHPGNQPPDDRAPHDRPDGALPPEEDPRLSAYVMGHLSPAEVAEVEARLEKDPVAREMVEQLRRVVRGLEVELPGEPQFALTEQQRHRIERADEPSAPVRPAVVAGSGGRWLAAAAAILLCVAGLAWWNGPEPERGRTSPEQVAQSGEGRPGATTPPPAEQPASGGRQDREALFATIPGSEAAPVVEDPSSMESGWSEDGSGGAPTPFDAVVRNAARGEELGDAEHSVDAYFEGADSSMRMRAENRFGEATGEADFAGRPEMERDTRGFALDDGILDELLEETEEELEVAEGLIAGDDMVPHAELHAGLQAEGGEIAARIVPGEERAREARNDPEDSIDGDAGDGEAATGDDGAADSPAKKAKENRKAGASTWKPAQVTPNASQLKIGDDDGLPLRGLQARVQVDGFRARVLLDCLYLNDRDQQYEGSFKLRLPDGATPWFFAFGESVQQAPDGVVIGDVFFSAEEARSMGFTPDAVMADRSADWKQPKEARMVPKEKAAHAYGETVRRRVDPALMEWSGAGVFSARVFPLAPNSLHRIVIGYDVDLLHTSGGLHYRLDLPETEVPVQVDLQVQQTEGLSFQVEPAIESYQDGDRRQYFFEDTDQRSFQLFAPQGSAIALQGEDTELGSFFAASVPVPVPQEAPGAGSPYAVFLLDTSLSASPDLFQVWARLLPAILESNEDSIRQFAVLSFDVTSAWWREAFVPNDAQHRAELARMIDGIALEGATDLGAALRRAVALDWIDFEDPQPCDFFLLSDGAATWGESEALALARTLDTPTVGALYAYRSGFVGTDLAMLNHLTRESGGAVFSVAGADAVPAAARAHRQRPWGLSEVRVDGVEDLLVAGRPSHVYPGQILQIAGRGKPAADAMVHFELSQGDRSRSEPVALGTALPSELCGRVYGQIAVDQLESYGDATEETSRAYAQHFRVTGRTCSLLMLETEEDYERFDIRPEQDTFVIGRRPVTQTMDRVLAELGDTLSSPKRRFLAFVEKMKTMPGMQFEVPGALNILLEEMPETAFEVVPEALNAVDRSFEGTPGALQELLAARKIDYAMICDEAARRLEARGPVDALRALSSLVEVRPGDGVTLRDVAFSAMEWDLGATAYHLLRRVAESRPYEPQTYWNLALCLEQMGREDLALVWFEVAMSGQWDARFGEFRRIAGVDYLRFLRQLVSRQPDSSVHDYAASRLDSLAAEIDLQSAALLVTMQWNTDRTDVDMHVLEPSGEDCYYGHRDTRIGGHLTVDVTQGYGPEMYILRKAVTGPFRVSAHYFASDQNRSGVRSKVYASVYRDWGTPQETVSRRVLTLTRGKDKHEIVRLDLK